MLTLTIDGKQITVQPGQTVLDAALAHNIHIPHLCYHPELSASGGCRLCLVEVEGRPEPVVSCGLLAADGMNITTQSEQLYDMRRDIIDLFVSDHPLDCVTCEKSGSCELQRYAYEYNVTETSYVKNISRSLFQDDNPFFIRDHKYCILCGKCTRVCEEVVGANAIEIAGRGFEAHMSTPFDGPMIDSKCVFCGNCVQVCPTAALMPVSRKGKGREWEMQRVQSVCSYCGVGCQIEYALNKEGQIAYAQSTPDAAANGEFLCTKGRYGWDFVTHPDRLTQPLIRRDLAFQLGLTDTPWQMTDHSPLGVKHPDLSAAYIPVDWDTALDVVAARLAEIVQQHGPDSVMGLASARCTNEENYLFQKFMRAAVGTNNIDHCARLCHSSTVEGLVKSLGSGAMTNSIRELRDSDCILITGSNTAEAHPVISYEIVRATKRGANLIIIDPRRVPLVEHATLYLQAKPGTDIYVFLAMMHIILREGWADEVFVQARTEGYADFTASLEEYTPERASLMSGVPVEKIEQAARIYALGQRAGGVSKYNNERGHSAILYAMGITQRSSGTDIVMSLANLAMMTGQIGKRSSGINPLRGQSNVQGACDVGCLVNLYPGYVPVTNDEKRAVIARAWGVESLPGKVGLTVVEGMQAAVEGRVRALYVMGENPMLSDPNTSHVEHALRAMEFIVAQDIFPSETAQLAHVILPAAAALEKSGTFTNTERRVQMLAPVLAAPGSAQPDWEIISELATRFDAKLGIDRASGYWTFGSTADIFNEIASVTPIYAGMSYARLAGKGLQWPCPDPTHPGTPTLHTAKFSRGLGLFHAIRARDAAEQVDEAYPLILTTGRMLYHYHTGTMTRRSLPLDWKEPNGTIEINAADASTLGVDDGCPVTVKSRRGEVQTMARVTNRVAPGTVFMAFHWREAPANMLTQDYELDPVAKIPEFKVCAVRVEKAE